MNINCKLLLFFGCSCLGIWVVGLLLQINQDTPLSYDQVVLNIVLPIVGGISLLLCYILNKYASDSLINLSALLFLGIGFIAFQIFVYIDTYPWEGVGNFLLNSVSGIVGILFILGGIFVFKE
jgi:hypothetical protein